MGKLRLAVAASAMLLLLGGCKLIPARELKVLPARPPAATSHWSLLFDKPDGVYLLPDGATAPLKLRPQTEDTRVVTWDIAPDGKHLALATANGGGEVMTLAPASSVALYSDSLNAGALDWSPDSATLAYVESGTLYLWQNGQKRTLVPKCGVTDIAWSPDGTQLVYGRRAEDDKDLGLWIVSTAGGEPLCLVKGNGDVFGAGNASWSPDGKTIAFLHSWEGGALCFIKPDGTGYRADLGPAWIPLQWLPDSSAVVYDALEDEITSRGVWRCSPTGQPEALISSGTSSFDMAPGGKLLVVGSPRENDKNKVVTVKVLEAPTANAPSSAVQKIAGTYANGQIRPDGGLAAVWVEGETDTGAIWLGPAGQPLTQQLTGTTQVLGWVRQ